MNILISEAQYKIILTEDTSSELKQIAKSTIDYAKNLKKKVMALQEHEFVKQCKLLRLLLKM